jgi:hypothetical protein
VFAPILRATFAYAENLFFGCFFVCVKFGGISCHVIASRHVASYHFFPSSICRTKAKASDTNKSAAPAICCPLSCNSQATNKAPNRNTMLSTVFVIFSLSRCFCGKTRITVFCLFFRFFPFFRVSLSNRYFRLFGLFCPVWPCLGCLALLRGALTSLYVRGGLVCFRGLSS